MWCNTCKCNQRSAITPINEKQGCKGPSEGTGNSLHTSNHHLLVVNLGKELPLHFFFWCPLHFQLLHQVFFLFKFSLEEEIVRRMVELRAQNLLGLLDFEELICGVYVWVFIWVINP